MRQQGVSLRITYQPTTFLPHTFPITQPLLKVLDLFGEVIDKILKIEKRKKRWKKRMKNYGSTKLITKVLN